MDYENIFSRMLNEQYFTKKDLMYDRKVNILFSPFEYKHFLDYKQSLLNNKEERVIKLELKSFNDYQLFYSTPMSFLITERTYLNLINQDLNLKEKPLLLRNLDDITLSRIYSEIEGTLNLESVPTTRKAVDEITSGKRDPKTLNEQIIKNMSEGIDYINHCPDFNKDNLFKLYVILSNGCLDEEDKLLDGYYYRHDGVEVGGYKGCPADKIDECMNSLFSYVNKNINNMSLYTYLPHIVHYYIVYIHPYFDYNGRTARMVSYWVSLLMNRGHLPPLVSEAINQTKSQYYNALSEARDGGNDLTYFLQYLFDVSIRYFLTYKNIEELEQNLKNKTILLTSSEKAYIKKILISNKGKFTHNDFTKWIDVTMSKQGALKILNALVDYGVLKSEITKSNKKLFEVDPNIIRYSFKD